MPSQEIQKNNNRSFDDAQFLKDNAIWAKMESVTVNDLLSEWIATLSNNTKINYISGLNRLIEKGMLSPDMTLQMFSQVNHDHVIDQIKLLPNIKETTRQARAALYISFTRFLARRFPNVFKKAMPCREGIAKTFYRVHEKVVTEAMNQSQWTRFFYELEKINTRDCLIAKITLQGGKRIGEVLKLRTDQINWEKREITFTQSKTKGVIKETVITYPESIMIALKNYIGDRQGFVFISHRGNSVILNQVANTFGKAGKVADISFKVTPHVLRASTVTYLKQQGFADSDIQKVTGHASSEMVNAYDKTDRANNASKRVNLIG